MPARLRNGYGLGGASGEAAVHVIAVWTVSQAALNLTRPHPWTTVLVLTRDAYWGRLDKWPNSIGKLGYAARGWGGGHAIVPIELFGFVGVPIVGADWNVLHGCAPCYLRLVSVLQFS